MARGDAPSGVIVVATGRNPVTFTDDLVANERRTLKPGTGEAMHAGEDGDSPGGGKVWRPEPLPAMIKAIRVDNLASGTMKAVEAMAAGKTVAVSLPARKPLVLSDVSELTRAARSSPGRLVIELRDDG